MFIEYFLVWLTVLDVTPRKDTISFSLILAFNIGKCFHKRINLSCYFSILLFNHAYCIGRMYSEKYLKVFRCSVASLDFCKRIMLFLCSEASFQCVALSRLSSLLSILRSFSSLVALPFRTNEVAMPYWVQNLRFSLLAYME